MVWPERIVLGVIGRRPDESSLIWAARLASRWEAQLHIVAGYPPPVGTFPHIVTAKEMRAARQRSRDEVTARLQQAVDDLPAPVETHLTLVTHNQLDQAIAEQAKEAGLALFSIVPTGLFAHRHRARAQRIAARLTCPVSLGTGQAVEPIGLDVAR